MATGSVSPKKNKVVDIPGIPTIGAVTDLALSGQVTVAFTAPSGAGGPAYSYTTISTPGSITGTGTSSPITVTGLTDNTSYTFKVAAVNATGTGEYSSASSAVTPTAPAGSFESIATVTVGSGGTGTISFSSIPSTYTHLQLRGSLRTDNANTGDNIRLRINGDTGSNYATHQLYGTGSSSGQGGGNGNLIYLLQAPAANAGASIFGGFVCDILDYASTNKNKTTRSLGSFDMNGVGGVVTLWSGVWLNTNAITSLSLFGDSTTFQQYSTVALYGIKSA